MYILERFNLKILLERACWVLGRTVLQLQFDNTVDPRPYLAFAWDD
jgi:hypothetical protein